MEVTRSFRSDCAPSHTLQILVSTHRTPTDELTAMETFPNVYRREPPDSLRDDVLLERIRRFRRDRHEFRSEEHETERLKLETVLAELESEAMKRGLR